MPNLDRPHADAWEDYQAALEETINRMFAEMDVNGDGVLSQKEITDTLAGDNELEEAMTKAGCSTKHIYAHLDSDGDSTVTLEEFHACAPQTPRARLHDGLAGGAGRVALARGLGIGQQLYR